MSLFLPRQCDGSAAADMHKGGQEQLIFEECQPTLSGYLVISTVEDLNLQTHRYCLKLTFAAVLFLDAIKLSVSNRVIVRTGLN